MEISRSVAIGWIDLVMFFYKKSYLCTQNNLLPMFPFTYNGFSFISNLSFFTLISSTWWSLISA